jgi:beta-glucosidase
MPRALRAAHHLLLAHGMAVPVIRANCPGAEVGAAMNPSLAQPLSSSAADYHAARHYDGAFTRWFFDPLYGRGYPADIVADYVQMGYLPSGDLDFVRDGDLKTIAAHTDFLGVNYYTRALLGAQPGAEGQPGALRWMEFPEDRKTEMNWEVYPDGLFELLARLYFNYLPQKIYITENGASYSDAPGADGRVRDERRIAYLRGHLLAAHRAIEAGVPLKGYFLWSLLDNFEWSHGYSQRFGLVFVDYKTQRRFPKDSAAWYGQVARRNLLEG